MKRILVYSALLIAGMIISQMATLESIGSLLHIITMVCLSTIMIEVGLEFSADLKHPRTYAVDAFVAAMASWLPWIFCAAYFVWILGTGWKAGLLVACFAAPTSAGVLFTLLAAAGLSRTWLFQKARVLAIFDDLATILLIIPLQMLFVGWKPELGIVLLMMVGLLLAGYRWVNQSSWPVGKPWLLFYGCMMTAICSGFKEWVRIPLDVLLPSFVMGCVLRHQSIKEGDDPHSLLDQVLKGLFIFLVGISLPKAVWGDTEALAIVGHVLALTVLSNLGKCVPLFCYRNEVSARERLALSVTMFPRGEVGAGVLLMALNYGISGFPIVLGSLSLALNLLMTGAFISLSKYLLSSPTYETRHI